MSKEQEAFEIIYNNFDYLISDVVIENDDVNICLKTIKEQLPTIKQALHRLEAIDNANPSEALEFLESIELTLKENRFLNEGSFLIDNLNTIKQALLKAQEQENKKYLKWEDLKFTDERQTIKVLLNGEKYFVKYKKEYLFGYYEKVEITNGTFVLCTLGSAMKQFFNDLRLERVEEWNH